MKYIPFNQIEIMISHAKYIPILFCLFALNASAQQSALLEKYRNKALEYNHDARAAEQNIEASLHLIQAARADLKPKLSAGAYYQFTGNPRELTLEGSTPLHFQAGQNQYGASLTLQQPLYAGGRLLETLKMAKHRSNMAVHEAELIKSTVCQQTDILYWNTVYRNELASISEESVEAVKELTELVRERVSVGLTDPNDLLIAEVKLNEANYVMTQCESNFVTGRMALNSLLGISVEEQTEVDSIIIPLRSLPALPSERTDRPERLIAQDQLNISNSELKLTDAKYLPQFYIGAEGSYSSPGYNFRPDLDGNYGLYAKLSVPLFEWGKRGKEKKASRNRIEIAQTNAAKTEDQIRLEIASAEVALQQSVEQVRLTENSLEKAKENERKSTERYTQGQISIYEVLQAQLYRQNAQTNHAQAKLSAQNRWSELQRALHLYMF